MTKERIRSWTDIPAHHDVVRWSCDSARLTALHADLGRFIDDPRGENIAWAIDALEAADEPPSGGDEIRAGVGRPLPREPTIREDALRPRRPTAPASSASRSRRPAGATPARTTLLRPVLPSRADPPAVR